MMIFLVNEEAFWGFHFHFRVHFSGWRGGGYGWRKPIRAFHFPHGGPLLHPDPRQVTFLISSVFTNKHCFCKYVPMNVEIRNDFLERLHWLAWECARTEKDWTFSRILAQIIVQIYSLTLYIDYRKTDVIKSFYFCTHYFVSWETRVQKLSIQPRLPDLLASSQLCFQRLTSSVPASQH